MSFGISGPKDWSPKNYREKVELERLLKFFRDKEYLGWEFDYAHPGFFSFYHPRSEFTIFFTPDWSEKDVIDIQVQKNDGTSTDDGGDVPFTVRTPENLFAAVKPWLDKYHPSNKKSPSLGGSWGPKDWSPLPEVHERDMRAWTQALSEVSYKGWQIDPRTSSSMMIVYLHPDSPLAILVAPEWDIKDSINVSVAPPDHSGALEDVEIPFTVRTAKNIFDIVRPWLDKYHPDTYRHRPRRRRS